MAPKSSNAENGGEATMSILSARDAKLITVALKSLPSNVKSAVNFDVIVSEMGLKDTKCARESFRQLCKKHGWFEADGTTPTAGTPSTPRPKKTPIQRSSAKRTPAHANSDDDSGTGSPTKKRKANPKKPASSQGAPKLENEVAAEDIDFDLAQDCA